jgi:hypothetical protein
MNINTSYRENLKDYYFIEVKEIGKLNKAFMYTIKDMDGNIHATRKSKHTYVAATFDGQYFFSRLDLIGKGDHGQQVKWCKENGRNVKPIAYLKTEHEN